MHFRALAVPDAWEITPVQHRDERGLFLEHYRFDRLSEVVGHPLDLRQANTSVSRRGTVRGIHFADVPPGQAKYVTVAQGAGVDYVVDIRVGSPTFGEWDSVPLDAVDRRAVYIPEGLGHCFVALEDDTTLTYLVSAVHSPGHEHAVNPLDSEIGLDFPIPVSELLLSEKDTRAPSLADAAAEGLLPDYVNAAELSRSVGR